MQFYNWNNNDSKSNNDNARAEEQYSSLLPSQSNLPKSLGISMHPVSDIDTAEITKILENAHRYIQMAKLSR